MADDQQQDARTPEPSQNSASDTGRDVEVDGQDEDYGGKAQADLTAEDLKGDTRSKAD